MLFQLVLLASGLNLATAARQSLCSSENTGSDITAGKQCEQICVNQVSINLPLLSDRHLQLYHRLRQGLW